VRDDHGAAHHHPEDVDRARRLGAGHLLAEERLLYERGAAAAELLGPGDPDVARVVELLLPDPPVLEAFVVSWGGLAGVVVGQPRAELVAEGRLRGREREVHAR
jgi:hypothetical protein